LSSPVKNWTTIHDNQKIAQFRFKVVKNIGRHRTKLPPSILEAAQSDILNSGTSQSPGRGTKERHEPSVEGAPFFDRQPDLNLIRSFVNSSDQGAFLVTGMKGIGKSALLRRVFLDVLPKWRCIWVQLAEGISFEQLVAECASRLDIPVNGIPSREEARHLARTVMTRIDLLDATGIVLDDCDSLLGPAGDFSDEETKAFLADLASKPSRKNAKVFLVSNISLPLAQAAQEATMHRHLRGLEQQDTKNLLEYWIRLQREELRGQPICIPEKLIAFLRGHPLAIRIAARLCGFYPADQLVEDLAIFKKLREAIVEVLLDKVVLTNSQRALLEFASIFRGGISLEVFRQWGGDAAILELDSLLARFLLEFSENAYWMHPAVAQYFYEQADAKKSRTHHKIAAGHFLRAFKQSQPKNISLLIEAIHHIAASGDIEQARSLGIHKEQLRTLAKADYDRKDWAGSLRYYEAITQIEPKDVDALAHMALGLGRMARWGEADAYFERARRVSEAYWIYQAYGAVKVRHPPRSGWLGEWGRLKGGCPVGLTRRAKARLGGRD
jgi:tetratricopeptide (TPR) repeat protein